MPDGEIWHFILIFNSKLFLVATPRENICDVLTLFHHKGLLGQGQTLCSVSLITDRVSRALVELVVVLQKLTVFLCVVASIPASSVDVTVGDSLEGSDFIYFVRVEGLHLRQVILRCLVVHLGPALARLSALDIVDEVFVATAARRVVVGHLVLLLIKGKLD